MHWQECMSEMKIYSKKMNMNIHKRQKKTQYKWAEEQENEEEGDEKEIKQYSFIQYNTNTQRWRVRMVEIIIMPEYLCVRIKIHS